MSDDLKARFLEIWEELRPLQTDAMRLLGEKTISEIRFRGHNENSSNHVELGTISLWINLNWEVDGHNQASIEITDHLTKTHLKTLLELWVEFQKMFDGQVEQVIIQLPSSSIYVPAINLRNVDQSGTEPYVYSLIL